MSATNTPASLDNCAICNRYITDNDPAGIETETGQRYCLAHRPDGGELATEVLTVALDELTAVNAEADALRDANHAHSIVNADLGRRLDLAHSANLTLTNRLAAAEAEAETLRAALANGAIELGRHELRGEAGPTVERIRIAGLRFLLDRLTDRVGEIENRLGDRLQR